MHGETLKDTEGHLYCWQPQLNSTKQIKLLLFHCSAFNTYIVHTNSQLFSTNEAYCCFPGNVNAPCSYVMPTLLVLLIAPDTGKSWSICVWRLVLYHCLY